MLISFLHLFQGIIIGAAISVSVGPMALITMKRTVEFGLRAGFMGGITIALIDTFFAILVLFGLREYLPFSIHIPRWIHALGILALFLYGFYLFTKKIKSRNLPELPLKKHFYDTILSNFANPSTYGSFGVITLLLARFINVNLLGRLEILVGFFIGATLWWLTIVRITFKNREHLDVEKLQKWAGILIMILAFLVLILPGRTWHSTIIEMFNHF